MIAAMVVAMVGAMGAMIAAMGWLWLVSLNNYNCYYNCCYDCCYNY